MDCEQICGGGSTLTGIESPGMAKQTKSSTANSLRLNPLLPPCLEKANFSGRKGVEVASSVNFFVCLFVFPPFPAAGSSLCSTGVCVENQFAFCGCLNKFKLLKP